VLTPAFSHPDYKPAWARAVDWVLKSDLRGMDPTRFTCRRDASKLETIYRAMRSIYIKTYANYTRSGQPEAGVFKEFTNEEHQLLYLHCLLFDHPSVDFVLRSFPQRWIFLGAWQSAAGPGTLHLLLFQPENGRVRQRSLLAVWMA